MRSFLDLIFPKLCYSCHQNGSYFCPKCRQSLTVNQVRIKYCSPFTGSLSLFPYDSAIKDAIHDLKYNFVTDVVEEIADLMIFNLNSGFPNLLKYWQKEKFVLTPVVLSDFRYNWRGFNQSHLLCLAFSELSGLEYAPNLIFRSRNNPPQVSLVKKTDRLTNTMNLFQTFDTHLVPKNIILFDDVCTTMSTLKSAARPLVDSGRVSELWGLSLAGYF